MGGGKDNHHVDKGYYSIGSYTSHPPTTYPYPYAQHGPICHPTSGSYPYPPPMYSSHSYYPPSGYPIYNQSAYPPMSGYHNTSSYAPQYHGHGSYSIGPMLAGGAATAATAYGLHHLTHGHHRYGHHGHYGKFKHGKFGKRIRRRSQLWERVGIQATRCTLGISYIIQNPNWHATIPHGLQQDFSSSSGTRIQINITGRSRGPRWNMDLRLAGIRQQMHLAELEEWREKAYHHSAKIYKERTKRWHNKRLKIKSLIQTRQQGYHHTTREIWGKLAKKRRQPSHSACSGRPRIWRVGIRNYRKVKFFGLYKIYPFGMYSTPYI